MATISQVKPKVIRGGRIEWLPIAAAQTWYRGQFVYLNSAGRMTACTSGATVTCGMAATDCAADTIDTKYPVYVSNENTLFELNTYHSTLASATTIQALVGNSYNYRSASYGCYVNRELQTIPFFKVVQLSPLDAQYDLFGRLWVTVVPEVAQIGSTL